jgi:hypothetical protein
MPQQNCRTKVIITKPVTKIQMLNNLLFAFLNVIIIEKLYHIYQGLAANSNIVSITAIHKKIARLIFNYLTRLY